MDLPENLKFQAVLTQGGAFYTKLTDHGDEYPRFYFVLNLNPSSDSIILLSTSTTRFRSHQYCDDNVQIALSSKDYEHFTEKCLVCCGHSLKEIPKEKLRKQLESQKFKLLKPLPKELLQKILISIAKSKVIPPKQKKLMLPEENNF